MTIGVCCLLALLVAGPGAEMGDVRAEASDVAQSDRHVSSNGVLVDVNAVCVRLVLPTADTSHFKDLSAQVGRTLKAKGMECVERRTGATPRLRIQIETVPVKDSGHTVYRVETVLNRLVTLTGRHPLRVQADVWRLPPAMKAVPNAGLDKAVAQIVLMQAEAFAATCRAAQGVAKRSAHVGGSSAPGPKTAPQQGVNASEAGVSQGPFVASKSSSVFHRPDCRWARNIAEHNRVTYKNRAEAIQAGKRPCKSCKP